MTTPKLPLWKRAEDLVVGLVAFIVASPLMALIAIAVLIDSGRPVLFVDERVGVGGRPFRMVKFRTMVACAKNAGLGIQVSTSDTRITKVGAVMRRWSLDELPQLVNVLRGEMSVVGPRPTYASQVQRYTPHHRGRLAVKPGITGLAQVSGRNDLSWAERIDRDLDYAARMSPLLDLAIIVRTPLVVLRGLGLYGRAGTTPDYDPGQ